MYHIFYEFCTNIMSLYWGDTHSLCWSSRIPWMEHHCDARNHAFYYPCIRRLFPQSSNCRTITKTPNTSRFFDSRNCRTFYGYNWFLHWCPPLPPPHRTLHFYRSHDRSHAEKKSQLTHDINYMKL